jgi:predicted O-methyltransferase YrrM
MKDAVLNYPASYKDILDETSAIGFDQLSECMLGSFLSTLSASKPNGSFLELGTGSGLSTCWILHGMDSYSKLQSVDNDDKLVSIARHHLGLDNRVTFIVGKGESVILNAKPNSIDFIFADTWPGKYHHLEETLSLLKNGGIYIIDDMSPQENWPEGHEAKALELIQYLEKRNDLILTKMCWSTGIIICTKKT